MGLRGQLSNHDTIRSVGRLTKLLDDALTQDHDRPSAIVPAPRQPYRLCDRLSPDTIAELVAAYDAGRTADDLAESYKIGKVGVLKLLHQHTAIRRKPPSCLTPEQMAEAARLYQAGLSIAAIGVRLGVPSSTLFRGFRVHGVPTRARGGTKQKGA